MQLLAFLVLPDRRTLTLQEDLLSALVQNAIKAIRAAAPGAPIRLVTAEPWPENLPPDVAVVDAPAFDPATVLVPPPTWLGDLMATHARGQTPPAEATLLVHALHPGLSGDLLRRALTAFAKDKTSPLVSVSPCRDHPCQFQRLVRLADMDMVYLLDPSPGEDAPTLPADNVAVTFPLDFAANERRCLQAKPGDRISCRTGLPVHDLENGQVLLVCADMRFRLLLAKSPDLDDLPERAGLEPDRWRLLGMFGHYRRVAALYADREGRLGDRFVLDATLAREGALRLTLVPIKPGATLWDHLTMVETSIPAGRSAVAVAVPPLPAEATAWQVNFLEDAVAGEFDFSIPCLPPNAPWGVEEDRLVNLETKRRITGRQAFPEVVFPDGTFAVFPASGTSACELEGARTFLRQEGEAVIMRDTFDHLCSLAWSAQPEPGEKTP